jgi:hypothetical protein
MIIVRLFGNEQFSITDLVAIPIIRKCVEVG